MTSTSDVVPGILANVIDAAEVHSVKLIEHTIEETEGLSQISATQQVQVRGCTPAIAYE
jgi:hypothetical protein